MLNQSLFRLLEAINHHITSIITSHRSLHHIDHHITSISWRLEFLSLQGEKITHSTIPVTGGEETFLNKSSHSPLNSWSFVKTCQPKMHFIFLIPIFQKCFFLHQKTSFSPIQLFLPYSLHQSLGLQCSSSLIFMWLIAIFSEIDQV